MKARAKAAEILAAAQAGPVVGLRPAGVRHARRAFLAKLAAGGLAAWGLSPGRAAPADEPLIAGIRKEVLWHGAKGDDPSWFHPRGCIIPAARTTAAPSVFMTLQTISGSDMFGPVHHTLSDDLGRTWSKPLPIEGLGRRQLAEDLQEGVCDVVPQYHAPTRSILCLGHNVYYDRNGKLTKPAEDRFPVYVVRRADGTFSGRRKVEWDDPRATAIYTSNCAQRWLLENGDILMPLSFGPTGRKDRSATTVRCSFDGEQLKIKKVGAELRNAAGRGLLEPSVTGFRGKYYLTLRAEDERGYVTVSDDGLNWQPLRAWAWEDGAPLVMSTTQQHWLPHSEALFLVYTRRTEQNAKVMRYRAPLFLAQVDTARLCLRRDTEQVVLPLMGDPLNNPKQVPLMGNFHPLNVTPEESWVTVGENNPGNGYKGDTLLARIQWRRLNRF